MITFWPIYILIVYIFQLHWAERLLRLNRVADIYSSIGAGIYALAATPNMYGLVLVSSSAVDTFQQRSLLLELRRLRDTAMLKHISLVLFGSGVSDESPLDKSLHLTPIGRIKKDKLRLRELKVLSVIELCHNIIIIICFFLSCFWKPMQRQLKIQMLLYKRVQTYETKISREYLRRMF